MQMPVIFLHPWLLAFALAVIPVLWLRRRRQAALGHSQVGMHKNVRSVPIVGRLPAFFLTLSFVAVIAALARPVLPEVKDSQVIETRDIIIAVDISGSMSAGLPTQQPPASTPPADGSTNQTYRRLDAAKDATVEFVQARPEDRIGILVFDDDSYWHWPLSKDRKIVLRKANLLNSYTGGGTNFEGPSERARGIGPLQSAITHFREYGKAKTKILVLVTDGEDSISQKRFDELTSQMEELGVKVYVLGVGEGWTNGATPDLQKFAEVLGGQVFRVGDTGAMQAAFAAINALEKSNIVIETSTTYRDIYDWFLVAAACLVVLFLGFSVITREDA